MSRDCRHTSEAAHPKPSTQTPSAELNGDPVDVVSVRVTARTVQVLEAIATNPGSNNRMVAEFAGITDPGQISKLLTRLQHARLIVNLPCEGTNRPSNAWYRTDSGAQPLRKTGRHLDPADGGIVTLKTRPTRGPGKLSAQERLAWKKLQNAERESRVTGAQLPAGRGRGQLDNAARPRRRY